MTTNFDSVQTLKSSDVCNKFSKSVSYETLVGGTATTGRERKQKESSLILRKAKFQAIFKFVLPLASKGTEGIKYNRISAFISMLVLLIRSSLEKFFKKNFRDDSSFCFGFAKVLALALIFTLITTAESRADDVIPTSGKCNNAGTCLWSLGSDGTLTISAKDGAEDVKMANYNCEGSPCDQSTLISRPWEASLQQIKNVVIGDNITCIGNDAFQAASNLTSVTGMKDVKTIGSSGVFAFTGLTSITIPEGVTSIGNWAFYNAKSLTSITIPEGVTSIGNNAFKGASSLTSITIPEGVTSIGNLAFSGAKSLTSITIPDNIDTANWAAEVFYGIPNGANIVCQGDLNTCYEKLAKYIPESKGGSCTNYCINKEIKPALFDSCKSTNYFWDGSTCLREPDVTKRKCCTSCKDMGGWCNRIRWTPAEAAEVLRDDNTNSVTITFKM